MRQRSGDPNQPTAPSGPRHERPRPRHPPHRNRGRESDAPALGRSLPAHRPVPGRGEIFRQLAVQRQPPILPAMHGRRRQHRPAEVRRSLEENLAAADRLPLPGPPDLPSPRLPERPRDRPPHAPLRRRQARRLAPGRMPLAGQRNQVRTGVHPRTLQGPPRPTSQLGACPQSPPSSSCSPTYWIFWTPARQTRQPHSGSRICESSPLWSARPGPRDRTS